MAKRSYRTVSKVHRGNWEQGLQLRIKANGDKFWYAKAEIKGIDTVCKTFPYNCKREAREWVQATKLDIKSSVAGQSGTSIRKCKMNEVFTEYLKYIKKKSSNTENTKRAKEYKINFWRDHIGNYDPMRITPEIIERVIDNHVRGGRTKNKTCNSASSINQYIKVLSHCFNIARRKFRHLKIPAENPASLVDLEKETIQPVRILTDREISSLLEKSLESSTHMYRIVLIALRTGARQGEILGLDWANVDLYSNSPAIHFPKTKNDESRSLPLTDELLNLFKEMYVDQDEPPKGLVFESPKVPGKIIEIKKTFPRVVERAGIQNFTFHKLRHTFCSYAVSSGLVTNIVDLSMLLGHKTIRMTQRYSWMFGDKTKKIMEGVSRIQRDNQVYHNPIEEEEIEDTPAPKRRTKSRISFEQEKSPAEKLQEFKIAFKDLKELHEMGAYDAEEFEDEKKKLKGLYGL